MTLAIGVIGVGVMGSEHARILREETSGAELIAVCDAHEGRAREAIRVVDAEIAKGRRLVQVGYMRRFDQPYLEMKHAIGDGEIGAPVVVHNIHRNPVAPDWFNGPMSLRERRVVPVVYGS
ncbi:Gfo/Idh/MocA family oxidoreductase [Burkholderia pyrrocinia]|uniref:Gfo/Idh/MocA family oxidoreductase n=1 Tax=Burkholderia pyrrocinia TaxID=60550 RepID=UPI000DEF9DBE|nr:Gfo/Idh/MocA family oxidoreductase [Burkholderia pyrrocinia]